MEYMKARRTAARMARSPKAGLTTALVSAALAVMASETLGFGNATATALAGIVALALSFVVLRANSTTRDH